MRAMVAEPDPPSERRRRLPAERAKRVHVAQDNPGAAGPVFARWS